MPGTGHQREVSPQLPALEVGDRFTVDEIPHLPPVELVRKLPTTWVVAEVKPDGSRDRWSYRLSKAALVGKTVKLLSKEFRPEPQVMPTLPPVPPSEHGTS
jgi:hypothetical protein